MKTTILLTAIASTAVFLSACKPQEATTAEASPESASARPYPLEVCLVSGEKLGSMGDPTSLVHEGQEIKFCCDHCEPKFKKDPAKYLSKLEDN